MAEKQVSASERLRIFARYAGERACVLRSAQIAFVVGTVLALVNHYQDIVSLRVGVVETIQILVTYLVPFSVATYGAASQGLRLELRVERHLPLSFHVEVSE